MAPHRSINRPGPAPFSPHHEIEIALLTAVGSKFSNVALESECMRNGYSSDAVSGQLARVHRTRKSVVVEESGLQGPPYSRLSIAPERSGASTKKGDTPSSAVSKCYLAKCHRPWSSIRRMHSYSLATLVETRECKKTVLQRVPDTFVVQGFRRRRRTAPVPFHLAFPGAPSTVTTLPAPMWAVVLPRDDINRLASGQPRLTKPTLGFSWDMEAGAWERSGLGPEWSNYSGARAAL
ncbi:hypothetical protein CPBF367_18800 [Xanthomonas arboricola pv. juglandis]|nr:hypothetical protein CPBF367_18800 [Xanthomonas arboricola pv. juglandis]